MSTAQSSRTSPAKHSQANLRQQTLPAALEPGDELHCPHCHRWHQVITRHATGTDYAIRMMYWTCRGATYYAGQDGHVSRHETRRPAARHAAHEGRQHGSH